MNEICLSCRKHTKCGRAEHETIGCGYYVPMTNEEYLKSCTTEQLAEAIYYLTWFHTELDERLDKNVKNGCYNDDENIKIVMEWLKQPHTTIKE